MGLRRELSRAGRQPPGRRPCYKAGLCPAPRRFGRYPINGAPMRPALAPDGAFSFLSGVRATSMLKITWRQQCPLGVVGQRMALFAAMQASAFIRSRKSPSPPTAFRPCRPVSFASSIAIIHSFAQCLRGIPDLRATRAKYHCSRCLRGHKCACFDRKPAARPKSIDILCLNVKC